MWQALNIWLKSSYFLPSMMGNWEEFLSRGVTLSGLDLKISQNQEIGSALLPRSRLMGENF